MDRDRVLYQKEYYKRNKEKSNLKSKERYIDNKEDVLIYHKKYYIDNNELCKEKRNKYKKTHKVEIITRKENYFINFDLIIVDKCNITLNFD